MMLLTAFLNASLYLGPNCFLNFIGIPSAPVDVPVGTLRFALSHSFGLIASTSVLELSLNGEAFPIYACHLNFSVITVRIYLLA